MLKKIFVSLLFLSFYQLSAQESAIYTNELEAYNQALDLYQDRAFAAAQNTFEEIKNQFDEDSEMRANCAYYVANCAIRLQQRNADELMQEFVEKYPNSTKRNDAFMEVADYYYSQGKYTYALKWLKKVKAKNMSRRDYEDYLFKYAYALFTTGNQTESKKYFVQLLDSQRYGSQAKYYYGYIAYQQDDYENADKYLTEVSGESTYKREVSYYLADMNFKLGKFQKAIDEALPLLNRANRKEASEINKIIGESYFNLKQYDKAIPYLKEYKGKRGKWVNTDYYYLGYAHYKQNDYEQAISYFNKIIDGNNGVAQNAYYHLGTCYVHNNQKTEALNAFKNASEMSFDPMIKEDAFLNYAKLSYEIGNPYKSVPEVLQDYLLAYPDSREKEHIKDLIINSYVTSESFQGALTYLEKNDSKNEKLIQEMAYLRGAQLYNEQDFEQAIALFDKSLNYKILATYTAKSTYWKAASQYQKQRYPEAAKNFLAFKNMTAANKVTEYAQVNYDLGYVYFKQKKYREAIQYFDAYSKQTGISPEKETDALLRLGDTYFVSSQYKNAFQTYQKARSMQTKTADYALFQSALCQGFINNNNQKISLLQELISTYSRSQYKDDAYFVLGNTYAAVNNDAQALEAYNRLISQLPKSALVPRAMLKKGLILYNQNRDEEALKTYKNIVNKYPKTAFAHEAVRNARIIYVDTGNVDEYATWVKGLDFMEVDDMELDNDMYRSAEKQYVTNNYAKAITTFNKYLQTFPNGVHSLEAHFYLAQSYEALNQDKKTIPHYEYIVAQTQSEYTEQALVKLGGMYLDDHLWDKAIPLLMELEDKASQNQNVIYAQSNMMKAYYQKENYAKAERYAEKVLSHSGVRKDIIADARIILARSAVQTGDMVKARLNYKEVEATATGEFKAEALYYKAYFMHQDGDYKNSNVVVQQIASDYATYKYWGAKSLIIMSKNFYALGDAYQATYILENVNKNFSQYQEVVDEATAELNKIKKEEAKTNDSVLPE